ncbi:MAG: tRNA epoxyqueuosine(34) reductase QueG, partial [Muribaculaceae bacterium]|nr:tRNA epoxyqueuosine(34) reductase QueG [Muribaculaceae bacterium]
QLLDGARSVISCAFPYQLQHDCAIASYALGDDYHEVLRQRLGTVAQRLAENYGAATRICVDTAPLLERYWAVKAGVGFIGRNHQLIVPDCGSAVLLGEILTTADIEPDSPCALSCGDCMACVNRCPGGALLADGTFDARRCLSYLTIEYRGEIDDSIDLHGRIYGCDECQLCCPHNHHDSCPEPLAELAPRPEVARLTATDVIAMDHDKYCATFRRSAIRRAKLPQLHRNATHVPTKRH